MRLTNLPGGDVQLTYCTNIHAGETWGRISASLDEHVPAIKAAVCPDAPFGLGLRLSGVAASELARPETLARFRDQLSRLGAYVFTLNVFPYGPFHGAPVKERVYAPDWRREERLRFTTAAARILAELLPEGGFGSLSTVPGAFRPVSREPGAVAAIVERLFQAAADLVGLERTTGRTLALALEPEPCCLIETTEEVVAFFENRLLTRQAVLRFAHLARLDPRRAERTLRRHLGVCYDVCHGAVEFEDPVSALQMLKGAGIGVPKIQLSAALWIPRMDPRAAARLRHFDTGVYLHQVVVRKGGLTRFPDLPEALFAYEAGEAAGEWRVHCHVPVFRSHVGPLGSTQACLIAALDALREEAFAPHLEVETYTWDVLPEDARQGAKAEDVAREIAFVLKRLNP